MLENKSNTEEDRVAIVEAQLAQAKLIAEEADRKYEEVKLIIEQKTNLKTKVILKTASISYLISFYSSIALSNILSPFLCRISVLFNQILIIHYSRIVKAVPQKNILKNSCPRFFVYESYNTICCLFCSVRATS